MKRKNGPLAKARNALDARMKGWINITQSPGAGIKSSHRSMPAAFKKPGSMQCK